MYRQRHQPLGEGDGRYERAGILLAHGQLDSAINDLTSAIALVEQVMHTLSSPEQWSTFLHQYTELYAQAAITEVRRNQDAQAHAILSSFIRIAGRSEIAQHIQNFDNSIL